jgi:biotin-(acetyl-CoA carboxylase) ligase
MNPASPPSAPIHGYDTLENTNQQALHLLRQAQAQGETHPHGLMVATWHQTQGKGAGWGRQWHSQAGQALCLSWAMAQPAVPVGCQAWWPHAAGWVAHQALSQHLPTLPLALKPLNDLWLVGDATSQAQGSVGKLGGILVESGHSTQDASLSWVVVGLGINCRPLAAQVLATLPYPAANLKDALTAYGQVTPPPSLEKVATVLLATLACSQNGLPSLAHHWLASPTQAELTLQRWRQVLHHPTTS